MSGFERGANPYPAVAPLPVRVPGDSGAGPVRKWQPPYPPEFLVPLLKRTAEAIRTKDSRPPLEKTPDYDAALAARHRAGSQPQPSFIPNTVPLPAPVAEAPAPLLPVQAAMPASGMLRWYLADLADFASAAREPIFSDTCPNCHGRTGMCRHHKAMAEESAEFSRLAAAIRATPTDQDAVLVLAAAATAGMPRPPAEPGWPGHRDRAVLLLAEAESAAMPETAGCCTDGKPCADHARDQDAAQFVGAIRDAAIDAGSAAELAGLITAVITEGGK